MARLYNVSEWHEEQREIQTKQGYALVIQTSTIICLFILLPYTPNGEEENSIYQQEHVWKY